MAAPDFYFAVNATLRWLQTRFGEEALTRYWQALAQDYYAPVARQYREGGLAAVEQHLQETLAVEPGAVVYFEREGAQLTVTVEHCPAIGHLRACGREVAPRFCEQCSVLNPLLCRDTGLTYEQQGGDGACRQVFRCKEAPR